MEEKFKTMPQAEKDFLDAITLKRDYKIYQKAGAEEHKLGLTLPLGAAWGLIETFKYVPGVTHAIAKSKLKSSYELNSANASGIAGGNPLGGDMAPILGDLYYGNGKQSGGLVLSQLLFGQVSDVSKTNDTGDSFKLLPSMIAVNTCLYTVTQSKNIVKTAIQGSSNGSTIKEYIADGDFVINCKGIICGPYNMYPLAEVQSLRSYLALKQNLPIICPYLNDIFGIKEVVIENYEFPMLEGQQASQTFNINMLSDSPVNLFIY